MKTFALVGLPNSGKTSIFNSLTNRNQKIANFPGITVDKKMGIFEDENFKSSLIDLPGLYTLDASSLDEKVARDLIFGKMPDENIDAFVLVMDATNIKKSLYLALQLKELGCPFFVALNMTDIAQKRGLEVDLTLLAESLGNIPVVSTVGINKEGVKKLVDQMKEFQSDSPKKSDYQKEYPLQIKETDYIKNKLKEVDGIYNQIIVSKMKADSFTERLDSIVLHPVWGTLILFGVLLFMFQLLFAWADPFVGMIESLFEFTASLIGTYLPDGLLKSLLIDGVLAGVGGIVVFLPHIVFLFIIINFLESFGYLGRAAFLLDFIMRKVGLPGKAVVPLLSSHACAIPGIMSARIIKDKKQRILTMMISPLMTCSARLPVYTLLIAVIVPNQKVMGIFGLPGLVMFALYMFAIVVAFIISFLAKRKYVAGSAQSLMMELPDYRVPSFKYVIGGAIDKGMLFLKKAGTIIVVLSVIIWGLVTFPAAPENATKPAIHYSAAAQIGHFFEPVFRPLGFDWKVTTALIPSFGAREVLVSAMGTVMAVSVAEDDEDAYAGSLSELMAQEYSLATLMALLIWFVFSPQCISTFGVLRKETDGYKLPVLFGLYTLALAYFFSFITFQIFS